MSFFKRSDLTYEDYSWTTYGDDDPRISGKPDSTFFNRKEAYEVLYLINYLADEWGLKSKTYGEKMEKMLHEYLPGNIRSQENVKNWIRKNWKN